MVGGGTRASRPTETKNDVPDECLLVAVSLRADEERPYLFSQTLFLSLFNVISTEALAKRRNPPRLSPDNVTTIIFFDLFTRCGSGHSRKAASRYGQVFSSVLFLSLVISQNLILDRGVSPHRRLFGSFSSPEKIAVRNTHG